MTEARKREICGYVVNRKLGSGSYGDVYEVMDKQTKQTYALKQYVTRGELARDMIIEIDILKSVDHLNLLKAHRVFVDSGNICLVLPLLEMDLKEFLKLKAPNILSPTTETLRLAQNLLCGLDYLHTNFIIHGDLKPANILIQIKDGQVIPKIADFGLSEYFISNKILYDRTLFTLYWRPPEFLYADIIGQAQAKVYYKSEVDVWAMGLILFEVFLGYRLITGEDEEEILKDIAFSIGGLTTVQEQALLSRVSEEKKMQLEEAKIIRATTPSQEFAQLPAPYVQFILRILVADPEKRLSARTLLEDPIFSTIEKCSVNVIEYDYVDLTYKNGITQKIRQTLVGWFSNITKETKISEDVFFLATDIFDRYFNKRKTEIPREFIQMYGVSCLRLASVLLYKSANQQLSLDDAKWLAADIYTIEEFQEAEFIIFSLLGFRLFRPTTNVIFPAIDKKKLMDCYSRELRVDKILECVQTIL